MFQGGLMESTKDLLYGARIDVVVLYNNLISLMIDKAFLSVPSFQVEKWVGQGTSKAP